MNGSRWLKLLLIVFGIGLNPAWADTSALGYKTLRFGHFPRSEWVIPQTITADRLYIRTKISPRVTQAQLQVDKQALIHSIGNAQSTSIPSELAQGYQKSYSDIQVFPLSPLKNAQNQIKLGWTLENSKQKVLILKRKQLQTLLKSLP